MTFFDDILNVYAYLRSKSAETARQNRTSAEKLGALQQDIRELNDQADAMLSDLDALLAQARSLAAEQGIDISDIAAPEQEAAAPIPPVSAQIKIPLPVNFDAHLEFQHLVRQAHDAGFTDAHPEDLLTAEEMARAEETADRLDEEFRRATRLQKKDVTVLLIAVAARVLCHLVTKKQQGQKPQDTPAPAQTASAAQNTKAETPAAQINVGQVVADAIAQKFAPPVTILDHDRILEQDAPFDIQETDLFTPADIVAYHKYLGWVVGTVNILTDTITTYGMRSYAVSRPTAGPGKPCVDREISTMLSLVTPVVRNAPRYKASIAAAAVQEALTQGFGKASPGQVRTIFNRTMDLENRTASLAEETKGALGNFRAEWAECIGGIAVTTLINTIVSAVHAILYEESDGSLDTYAVRTSRIILYSGAIATTINSLPAIAEKDVSRLDFAGILTTCVSLFQSTRFWIDAKAAYLVSAYRPALEQELAKLDKYFQ